MIFGTSYPIISGSAGSFALEHCKLNYNFFGADVIEHVSVLTGHKSHPYSRNKSSFQLDILLCNYSGSGESSSLAKFNDIYRYKDEYFNFFPHSDFVSASVDVYGAPIEYFMSEFIPYYLEQDNRYDGILITLEARKNSVLRTKVPAGYGTAYGIDYGRTGW